MMAAVATAIGLYAADDGFISGAGFDTTDTANPTKGVYTWLNTAGGTFTGGYWTIPDGAVTTITAEPYTYTGEHPKQFTNDPNRDKDQYLAIKTTLGTPVSQNIKAAGSSQMIGDGLYFDGLVKPRSACSRCSTIRITSRRPRTSGSTRAAARTSGRRRRQLTISGIV